MHYSIICFKNQAMFALIKKDCYYGVTTDLNFVLLDNKMKKVPKLLHINGFGTSLLVIHRRFELRTP